MQNFGLNESILLNQEDLDQRRVVPNRPMPDSTKRSNCDFEADQANFVLLANVSDLSVRDNTWYVLCAEFNSMEMVPSMDKHVTKRWTLANNTNEFDNSTSNGSDSTTPVLTTTTPVANTASDGCNRCVMIKTTTQPGNGQPQFLQYNWIKDQFATNRKGGILRYVVGDLPFQSAKLIVTIAIPDRAADQQNLDHTYTQSIKPRQEIFIHVPFWEETATYWVKTDVYPEDKEGKPFYLGDINLPLVLTDYLYEETEL